jgi:hypothetical protein
MIYIKIPNKAKKKTSEFSNATELLKSIPWLSIWNVILAGGGIFLLAFCQSIDFLPDLDLKEITTTLAGIALVGIQFVAAFGFALLVPALFQPKELTKLDNNSKILILFEALLGILIAGAGLFYKANDGSYSQEVKNVLSAIHIVILALFIVIGFLNCISLKDLKNIKIWFKKLKATSLTSVKDIMLKKLSATTAKVVVWSFRASLTDVKDVKLKKLAPILSWLKKLAASFVKVLAWSFWAFIIPIFSYVILSDSDEITVIQIFILFCMPICFAIISIMISTQEEKKIWLSILILAPVCIIILGMFVDSSNNSTSHIFRAPLNALGLTITNKNVDFVVTENACNAANTVLSPAACNWDASKKQGHICNAKLTSRIGSQVLLHWPMPLPKPLPLFTPFPADQNDAKKYVTQDFVCPNVYEKATDKTGIKDTRIWKRLVLNKQDVIAWGYPHQDGKNKNKNKSN